MASQTTRIGAMAFGLLTFALSSGASEAPATRDDTRLPDSGAPSARVRSGTDRLRESHALTQRVAAALRSLPDASDEALEKAKKRNEELRKQLSDRPAPDADATRDPSTLEALERELAKLTAQHDSLLERQAKLIQPAPAPANSGRGLRQEAVLEGMKPVAIMLTANRVVPFDEPYFTVQRAQVRDSAGRVSSGMVIERVSEGVAVRDALREGGILDSLLNASDKRQKFFHFLVCADSISAFNAVVDEVSRRGFAYGWDTARDQKIIVGDTSSGGSADFRGVRPRP